MPAGMPSARRRQEKKKLGPEAEARRLALLQKEVGEYARQLAFDRKFRLPLRAQLRKGNARAAFEFLRTEIIKGGPRFVVQYRKELSDLILEVRKRSAPMAEELMRFLKKSRRKIVL